MLLRHFLILGYIFSQNGGMSSTNIASDDNFVSFKLSDVFLSWTYYITSFRIWLQSALKRDLLDQIGKLLFISGKNQWTSFRESHPVQINCIIYNFRSAAHNTGRMIGSQCIMEIFRCRWGLSLSSIHMLYAFWMSAWWVIMGHYDSAFMMNNELYCRSE